MKGWLAATAVLGAGACAAPDVEQQVTPGRPIGTTHVPSSGALPPEDLITPPAARRLATAVEALERTPDSDHGRVVRALRELANALEAFAPQQEADVEAIRSAAEQLESSAPRSALHADYVRSGLEGALRVFVEITPAFGLRAEAYGDHGRAFGRAVAAIDPDAPLLEQHAQVVSAFRAATRTIYVAFGAELPPGW